MKCPLQEKSAYDEEGIHSWVPIDCLKEQCEWYRLQSQQCALSWLAGTLSSLVGVLQDIRDKLDVIAKATGIRG